MKIMAYCCLFYGREWLEHAIRSLEPVVDEYHIFYTDHPSHGSTTKMTKPEHESRDNLKSIADMFPFVVWHDVTKFWKEGDHRDYCENFLVGEGADIIIVNDSDEVWDLDEIARSIDYAWENPFRNYGTHAMHFWRGVNWVCYDACMPIRIIKPSGAGTGYISGMGFYHFGYAQSEMLILYKSKIHGHRSDWRKNWWTIYKDWKPGNEYKCGVHPTNECDDKTGKPFWTPEPFDRFSIEYLIGDHPYFSDELI